MSGTDAFLTGSEPPPLPAEPKFFTLPDATATQRELVLNHNSDEPLALQRADGETLTVHLTAGICAQILELTDGDHASTGSSRLQIRVDDGASLIYARIDLGGNDKALRNATSVRLGREAHFEAHDLELGAGDIDHDLEVAFTAPGAVASFQAVVRAEGKRQVRIQSLFDHAVPECTSRQLVKCVLNDDARVGVLGRTLIRPGAHGTHATQSNRNLLLSSSSQITSRPQLEIYDDDVEASHGSATGNLDEAALFFLRSRGFSFTEARGLLVRAFLREITDTLPWPALQQRIAALLEGNV